MRRRGLGRRSFLLRSSLVFGTGCLATRTSSASKAPALKLSKHPVVVSSNNGHPACNERVMEKILAGEDLLHDPACNERVMEKILAGEPLTDALVAGVNLVENDPKDHSVGYGGLPNEDGVVELDASVMDGATGMAGAVASLRGIKNPSQVALRVMRNTDHCLLVGEGALRFARAHGFKEEDLLTEEARQIWMHWKASHSDNDDWIPGDPSKLPPNVQQYLGITGTINCDAVDTKGNLAGVTTTSGLAFKIPGRVGDSPIIGAGLYVDNDVGAAGSTGRGEANIITTGAATVVEGMRQGKHPKDACLYACERIARMTKIKRLLTPDGKPNFNVKFYAVDRSGRHGGGAIWSGGTYAVFDSKGNRTEPLAHLYRARAKK